MDLYCPLSQVLTSQIGGMAGKLIEYPFDTVKVHLLPVRGLISRFAYRLSRMENHFNFGAPSTVSVKLLDMRDSLVSIGYEF